ncbi:hypothetical protein Vretimale_3442 [Volvox reticuliferus]|uniref:Uncharacterized protein n=1 Tax=Volvox reticuliferus TaxID=1737510 RepID=A0A8J4BXX9_9CHLO|nr:hypothetical protein Vretifemale_970 [Volvox reticuliferus]GIL98054.1 hypothetical protein Vretimale_3442 [Volvox reticuliferus]
MLEQGHDRLPGYLDAAKHLLIPPLEQKQEPSSKDGAASAAASLDESLMVIFPGALLPVTAFKDLAAAVQKATAPHLRLWVGVLDVDIISLTGVLCGPNPTFKEVIKAFRDSDVYGKMLQNFIDYAVDAGFVPQGKRPGRISNLLLVGQSAGCVGMVPTAVHTAAASVMLAGVHNSPEYTQLEVFIAETWTRPLMMLVGELDGQMRWPLLSPYIAETAAMATKFGPGFAAVNKPVVVVSELNHGHTSNGQARTQRGDITAGVAEYGKCIEQVGGLIGAFATAHLTTSAAARSQASRTLLNEVRQSMCLTAPYCIALGLGNPAAAFPMAATGDGPGATGASRAGGLVTGAQRIAGQDASTALHPGEVAEAEAHAVKLQLHVLAGLPPSELQRLTVVATAHTDVETFLYSQPVMLPQEGPQEGPQEVKTSRWLLHIHVMMHYKALDAPGLTLAPRAPDYWLKLKCAQFVAAMLHLPNPDQYATPAPAELNRLALEAALAAAPLPVVERYRALGRQLEFGPDTNFLISDKSAPQPVTNIPEDFVRNTRISFNYCKSGNGEAAQPQAPSGAASQSQLQQQQPQPHPGVSPGRLGDPVRVISPYVLMPAPENVASFPCNEARFVGPFYVKVISIPQAMEWIWLDSLREIETPW